MQFPEGPVYHILIMFNPIVTVAVVN